MTRARKTLTTGHVAPIAVLVGLALAACSPEVVQPDTSPAPATTPQDQAAPPTPAAPEPVADITAPDPVADTKTPPTNDCAIELETYWEPPNSEPFLLTATSSCDRAGRVLVERRIINMNDEELFTAAHYTDEVMTLAWHEAEGQTLEEAVAAWLEPDPWRGSELPDWNEPSEFPFIPSMTREAYEDLRERDAPLLCYVQGMESALCLTVIDGEIQEAGIQIFPG